MLSYHLVAAQYWVHQVSSTCLTTPENDMGQSNSGTEMSIYTSIVQAETDDLMKDFKWTSTKYTLSLFPPKSWSNKAGIIWFWDIRQHQSSGRGWFRSTFWGQLTFEGSQYAWHDIPILLWWCYHPPNKPASFLYFFSCTFDIRIVCIITGHIAVMTHVPPM